MIQTQTMQYQHQDITFESVIAYDESATQPRPAVLVFPDWSGRNLFSEDKAKELAAQGYVAMAVDMYGGGQQGQTVAEKQALMMPLMEDRRLLADRVEVALMALLAAPQVNQQKVAALGFCFGGLCALDLARRGAAINGVVSFHGLLQAPEIGNSKRVKAKVLVLHGYDDPMVSPKSVNHFAKEMTQKGVDWQLMMYGQTQHAFTNPLANDKQMGTVYNERADKRAKKLADDFLVEIFG